MSGEAGASLARVLEASFAFDQYQTLAMQSTRMPNSAFEGLDVGKLESSPSLFRWGLWVAEAFPRDPRFQMRIATHFYGLAVAGIAQPVELSRGVQVVPSFTEAHRRYLRAAELAEASVQPVTP